MKLTFLISGVLVSFCFTHLALAGEKLNTNLQEPATKSHVKMIKVIDGKKTVLDTVITGNNTFVWQGDTLNSAKLVRKFAPYGFDKSKRIDIDVDRKSGNEKVMIFRHDGNAPMIWKSDSGKELEELSEELDSLGKRITIRKRISGEPGRMMIMDMPEGKEFRLPPHAPHMQILRKNMSGQMINLNDPGIISFRKKDLKGGREKIEIIRKKKEDTMYPEFGFDMNEGLLLPPAPESPEFEFIEKEIHEAEKAGQKTEREIKEMKK